MIECERTHMVPYSAMDEIELRKIIRHMMLGSHAYRVDV